MRAGARAHRAGQESEGVYIKPEVAHATSYAAQPTLSGEGRNTSKPRARSARPSVMLSRLCGRSSTEISCYHHQMHLLYSHRPNLPTGQIRRLLLFCSRKLCSTAVHAPGEVLVTARHLADDANGEAAVTRGTATNTIQGHTPHQHRRCSSSGTNPSYPHTQASAPARPPRPTTSLECPSRN